MVIGENTTIYFIYLGKSLPNYGPASLALAQKTSGSKIHLIGNQTMRQVALQLGIEFTSTKEFYDSKKFDVAKANISSDASFRDGLWIKSMERLFVLEQFMIHKGLTSIFHAELDQLLFGTHNLITTLNSISQTGLFVPFHDKDSVVASVLYVNDLSALQSVTTLACGEETFNNEMMLLAKWALLNPERTFALPTLATELKGSSGVLPGGVELLSSSLLGGVVDAAQVGQWVGGIDPRNIPIRERPRTKFVDEPSKGLLSRKDLDSLTLQLGDDCRALIATQHENSLPLYNLHLHSKSHRTILRGNPSLEMLFLKSNQINPFVISGMRKIQLISFFSKILRILISNPRRLLNEIEWRVKFKLNIRPSSYPFLSGDTFRKISQFQWESKIKQINPIQIQPGDVVFCESELFGEFKTHVLSKTKSPIVLILGNSDKNHARVEAENYNHPSVAFIFAQNILDEIPNFAVLPIGLENAWRSKHGILNQKMVRTASTSQRLNRVMWGFNVRTNPFARNEATLALKKNSSADNIGNVTPKKHQSLLRKYAFVACPPGNGLDTHRTWEAMYFKCVPIVLRSFMTSYYESIGLPIWVVDSYSDIEDFDESALGEMYKQFQGKFAHEAIWADYWIHSIQAFSEDIRKGDGTSMEN
jgi:hypothetical protein